MSDIYHRDTKKALDNVQEEDWTFLHQDLQDSIENFCSETDGLLDEYVSKQEEIEELQEKVAELEGRLADNGIE